MRAVLIACLAIGLSGCAGFGFDVDHRTTPQAQKLAAEGKAAFDKALAARLEHCQLNGQIGAGLGGIAGAGTGFSATGSFNCPAKPYPTDPAPPRE